MHTEPSEVSSEQAEKPAWSPPRLERLSLIEVESVADLDVAFTCTYTHPTSDLR